MANEWDKEAAGWDENPAVAEYCNNAHGQLAGLARDAGISLDGVRAVDFGCGSGQLTEKLVAGGAAHVAAVDISAPMLDVLRAKASRGGWADRVDVRLGNLPSSDEKFDLVVCSSVLAFVDDYPGKVQELVALLRPGGMLVQWDWEAAEEQGESQSNGLSRDAIRAALTAAGLEAVAVGTAFRIKVEFDGAAHVMEPLFGHGRVPC